MEKIISLGKDIGRAFALGLALSAAASAAAFLAGLLVSGKAAGLEAAKDTVFFICAVLLFLLAGMILVKGKRGSLAKDSKEGWKRHFSVIGPETAAGCIAAAFALAGIVLDYCQRL